MEKKLYRSQKDRMIAGVCGGLAEYLQVDPVWIRLFFLLLLFASTAGFWAYVILWIIVPEEGREGETPSETVQANVQDMADRARELGHSIQRGLQGRRSTTDAPDDGDWVEPAPGMIIVALAFITLGGLLLVKNLGFFAWLNLDKIWWPMLIIALGVALLVSRIKE